jgi:hypothetical protein
MKPDEIDQILSQSAYDADVPNVSNDAMQRIEHALLSDLIPVRPLPGRWVLVITFFLIFAAFSVIAGSLLGLDGLHVLSQIQRVMIFSALVLAAWLAAVGCVREMRPGSGQRLFVPVLALAAAGMTLIFALVLHNYSFTDFVAEGVPCLIAGMEVSIPTGILLAFVLRRGFVMDWSWAGGASGTLAGLAGLGMLELHCKNLKAIHVIAWHVAVVLVSAMIGFAIGLIADEYRRRKAL